MKIRYREDYDNGAPRQEFSASRQIRNGTVNDLMARLRVIAKPLEEIMLKDIFDSPRVFERAGIYIYFDPISKAPACIGESSRLFVGKFRRPLHWVDGELFYYYSTAEMWKMPFAIICMEGAPKETVQKLETLLIATTRPPINKLHNTDAEYERLKEYLDHKTIGEYMKS